MTKVVVMSLGQLADSDIQASYDAFTQILEDEGKWFASARVRSAYALDMVYHKTINAYKCGTISFEEFHARFNDQLGVDIPEDTFLNAWNAMCTITDKNREEFAALVEMQKEHPFILCVVAGTNNAQCDYIYEQWKTVVEGIDDIEDIHVTASFDHGTLDIQALGKIAIADQLLDQVGNEIISLNNKFTEAAHLGITNARFEYQPFNTKAPGASLLAAVSGAIGVELASHEADVSEIEEEQEQEERMPLLSPAPVLSAQGGFALAERQRRQEREKTTGCCPWF